MYPIQIEGALGSYLCEVELYGYSYAHVVVSKVTRHKFLFLIPYTSKTTLYQTRAASYGGLDRWSAACKASPEQICAWYKHVVKKYEDSILPAEDHKQQWDDFYKTHKLLQNITNSTGPK